MFLRELFFSIWFFLPVGIANSTPIIAAKIPILQEWSYPLDCYKIFRGKRILGDHKTIRGLIVGILMGILTIIIEQHIYNNNNAIKTLIPINYAMLNPLLFGTLSGLGALGADAIKSFFKRRIGLPPSTAWFPFDQIDYIVGGIIATSFLVRLTFFEYILIIIVWFCLHIVASRIGYFLHLKNVWY